VHADAEVIFIRPGVVVLSGPHPSAPKPWQEVYEEIRNILDKSVDAKGCRFEVHTVYEPDPNVLRDLTYDEPATNYVNCYFVNCGLIVPQFGDEGRIEKRWEKPKI
jgi:agmatine/peptidylarginine deiminase